MTGFPLFIGAVFAVFVVLGAGLSLIAYKTMEAGWPPLAAVTGTLYVGVVLIGVNWFSAVYLETLSWQVFEYSVYAAVLGTVIGVSIILAGWEPELDDPRMEQDDELLMSDGGNEFEQYIDQMRSKQEKED